MNKKVFVAVCLAVAVIAGSYAIAQQSSTAASAAQDPRIDKLLEQNEQILKNQADILKQIGDMSVQLGALRRRSS